MLYVNVNLYEYATCIPDRNICVTCLPSSVMLVVIFLSLQV